MRSFFIPLLYAALAVASACDALPPSPDPEPSVISAEDEEILKELRSRFDYAAVQWAPNIERGNLCLAYADGDTWNQDDAAVRRVR